MKSILKNSILILTICFSITAVLAQEANNDAVYKKLVKEYTLKSDGSYSFHLYKEVQLLSYYSINRMYGETFIIYNPDYQKLKINKAYTVMADGGRVAVPDNAFNKVLPRYASKAPAFNDLREMVVTHTGLEKGAVIYMDYTIQNAAGFMPAFMGNVIIPTSAPIREMELIVKVPAGKTLYYKTLNIRTAPDIINIGGVTVYSWKFKHVDAAPAEGQQVRDDIPRVLFSTTEDLMRVYFKFVNQPAFTYQTNDKMDTILAGIIDDCQEDELKIAMKIQQMVANEISTYSIPPDILGYRARTPVEVWNSNGGTQLEKAILMTSLLLKANINAVPIAVIPTKFYDDKLGTLMNMEEFIVRLNTKKYSRLYLSPTRVRAQNLSYSLGGKTLLILDGAIESLKTFDEKDTRSVVRCGGTFVYEDAKSLKGNLMSEMTNGANPYFDLLQDSTKIKGLIQNAKVTDFEFRALNESRTVADLKVELFTSVKSQSTYLFWSIPESRQGVNSWHIDYMPDKRVTDIEVPGLIYERYEYILSMPGNYVLVTVPRTIDIDNDFCKVKITLTAINNDIVIIRELEIKKKVIPATDYADLKSVMDAWLNDRYRTLVIKKTE